MSSALTKDENMTTQAVKVLTKGKHRQKTNWLLSVLPKDKKMDHYWPQYWVSSALINDENMTTQAVKGIDQRWAQTEDLLITPEVSIDRALLNDAFNS